MQTFCPLPSFEESARCLDDLRLANQRNEARTILRAVLLMDAGLARVITPWGCHTAVRMWRNYPDALKAYYNAILAEWIRRGGNNKLPFLPVPAVYKLPSWLGDQRFMRLTAASS